MTAWQIEASWTAAHVDEDTETEQAEALLDGLAPQHIGAVIHPAAGPAGWWGITITIEAPTLRQANALALALLTAAVGNAGQKSVTWRELAIVEQPEADRRLLEPDVPDLVAFADIAETAGVSRQRARQLAESPTFPGPVYDGRAGRLFVKAEIDRFMAARPGRPGRPRKRQTHD